MEVRELEAFVAVAAERHFGRAATRLHLGTPSLSELVRRLERELGTPLFTRTTRRVALTSAGEELLARAETILDEVSSAKAAVQPSPPERPARCASASRRRSPRSWPHT